MPKWDHSLVLLKGNCINWQHSLMTNVQNMNCRLKMWLRTSNLVNLEHLIKSRKLALKTCCFCCVNFWDKSGLRSTGRSKTRGGGGGGGWGVCYNFYTNMVVIPNYGVLVEPWSLFIGTSCRLIQFQIIVFFCSILLNNIQKLVWENWLKRLYKNFLGSNFEIDMHLNWEHALEIKQV